MKQTTAIICEFNPIHPGHRYILSLASVNSDAVIAVMSGNFVQRGQPAVFDKYTRAEAAVRCGADLVVELPFPWCSSGVEDFALGGVSIASGCLADSLTFGSENGELQLLKRAADCKDSDDYAERMRIAEKNGRSRGSAVLFDEIMKQYGIAEPLGANDKLGAEYIRFGREKGITDFRPVRRMKDSPSASEVRRMLHHGGLISCGELVPEEAKSVFADAEICRDELIAQLFFTHCRLYVGESEENELLRYAAKMARASTAPAEFMEKLPTKKYTAARMRREILFSLLGVKKEKCRAAPRFTLLLAANEKGRAYLSENAGQFTVPLITKPADHSSLDEVAKEQYELHRKADELYAYLMGWPADTFMKRHPRIV